MTYKKNLWFTLIAVLPVLALNVSAGNIVFIENNRIKRRIKRI